MGRFTQEDCVQRRRKMSDRKSWAPEWKTTYGPEKEKTRDVFWAEFEDDSNNTVRVRITIQELKKFGKAPENLQEKRQRTEQVVRAILETYISKRGMPTAEIDARDLGIDLAVLKREFAEGL